MERGGGGRGWKRKRKPWKLGYKDINGAVAQQSPPARVGARA